ncbi:hypothetical protein ACSBR2_035877 [Camellia fascicularis]
MYSFPQPGSVTICEINRDLITAESLSDNQAKETYAKVLRILFSAVSFRTDHLLPSLNLEQGLKQLGRIDESVQRNSWSAALRGIFSNSLKRLFHPNDIAAQNCWVRNRGAADGSTLVEQLLDVVGKDLDQNNICSTNIPWSDTSKDDMCGNLTSSQCGLVELTALVFYRACVNKSKAPSTEK